MSELVPEVGDVWQDENKTIFKIFRCFYFDDKPEFNRCDIIAKEDEEFFITTSVDAHWIAKKCKYLGKSKANINQLFEVNDDKSQEEN